MIKINVYHPINSVTDVAREGSGHFPIYEFEVLIEIYKECGYREREAAEYILRDNLYGLDIDERARQLAYFSLMMKARSYNRRILNKDIEPNIYAIPDSNSLDKSQIEYFGNSLDRSERKKAIEEIEYLIGIFEDGKNLGSIIKVEKCDFELLRRFINDIDQGQMSIFNMDANDFQKAMLNIINVAEVMTQKYEVVATNPPYLNKFNPKLKKFVNDNYKDYKQDLFSVFIYRNFHFCKENGYSGFMTPFVWMFIKSYEKLREYIIDYKSIATLVQMEYSAFEEATVPICSFVLKNGKENTKGLYFKLSDFTGGMEVQKEKVLEAIGNPECGYFYETSQGNFKKIPGMPVAYWASEKIKENFDNKKLNDYADAKFGLSSADNNKYIRKWYEVDKANISFPSENFNLDLLKTWFPINNGGKFKKWYGNNEDILYWLHDGYELKNNGKSTIRNKQFYYLDGITWTPISSSATAFRRFSKGYVFTSAGFCIFSNKDTFKDYLIGLLNSKVTFEILKILSPTLNYNVGDICNIPIILNNNYKEKIIKDTNVAVSITKLDWDMHETSWDFEGSPLIANKVDGLLSSAYEAYKSEVNDRFSKLKENEEELNRIFIDIYGLESELTPEVSDKDITVAKIFDNKDDIYSDIKGNKYVLTREDVVKNFLSYFIGCCMGRYSLDNKGLAFAGGEFDESKYQTFKADEDGILPFTDQEYFEDDIIVRLEEFLKVTFGAETVKENLDFIASELKGKAAESSKEKIRNYFLNDFYKDHCKMYQKRPIYWLCDSGKLGASRNLIYMHRYKKDTIARLRIRYVFEIQDRYKQELDRIENLIDGASGSDRVNYQKQADKLKKLITETQGYEEKVQHLADSYIEIDLDDGVKENYKLFKDILAKI